MTIKPKTPTPIVQAIARHKAVQAAADAVPCPEECPEHLREEENEALDELAFTPCASDAEFLEKLRYLYAQQAKVGWDLPDNGDDYGCIVIAAACHFCPVNL
jgi:hypothetical protein